MNESYKLEAHNFGGRILAYSYCAHCGLIRLHNQFTAWCVAKGCNYRDHPGYAAARHKFTNPWRKK